MRKARISIVLLLLSGLLLLPLPAYAEGEAPDEVGEPEAIVFAGEASDDQTIKMTVQDEPATVPGEVEGPTRDNPQDPEDPEEPGEPEPPIHEDGWEYTEDGTFYWSDGVKITGWFEVDGKRYCFDASDGHMLSNGIYDIEGLRYCFDGDGAMVTGWVGEGTSRRYFDPETGAMAAGDMFEIDGSTYCFDSDGALVTGWVGDGASKRYFNPETGAMAAGDMFEIDGSTYCFDPDGVMVTGWVAGDSEVYYFDPETGTMISDTTKIIEGLCAPVAATGDSSFADVSGSTAHEENIEWMLGSGISTGWVSADGTRTFRPYTSVARCDMAAFLYRLAGSPSFLPEESDTSFFSDVNPETPHANEVWWLARMGISEGWVDKNGIRTFRPLSSVARADMAAFLYRLANPSTQSTEDDPTAFTDVTSETAHASEIEWLANEGISEGWRNSDGTSSFRPLSSVARADMAAFLNRMISLGAFVPSASHEYLFAEDGSLVTGWVGDIFYDRSSGAAVEAGWVRDGSDLSYLDPSTGELLKDGVFPIAGYSYLFDEEGKVQHGWIGSGNALRYYGPSSGMMYVDGFYAIDGAKYLFKSDGSLTYGWADRNGATYYLDPSTGKMKFGWNVVDGAKRFFDRSDGHMFKNGIFKVDGSSYCFAANGTLKYGLQSVGGSQYYFDPSTGKMYVNKVFTVGSTIYKADASGRLTKQPARYLSMFYMAQDYSSPTDYLILIDAGNNVICVYEGYYGNWIPVIESLCSTGAPATYTPSGVYYSGAQGYSFSGDGHTCYYYTQIYGDVLIHSILYHEYTFDVMDGRLGMHISGGCVRCPIDVAKWIYDNVPYYTKIVVYR